MGLVEASIGRMVPVQTPQMQAGNPLRVCVERYGFLPVDKDAFRGEIPNIQRLVPYSPFDYYIPVSYTHLDVYKRQVSTRSAIQENHRMMVQEEACAGRLAGLSLIHICG